VQVGLGISLIARDAVARELDEGTLEEWVCATLPRRRAWHVVARTGDVLAPTARPFLSHLVRPPGADGGDRFRLDEDARATFVA